MVILEKIVKVLIIMMYVTVYAYSAWMTTIEPDRAVWGWICTLTFGIGALWGISEFVKHNNDARKEEGNSSEEGVLHKEDGRKSQV